MLSKVSDWRSEWERVWTGDTGMDIQGSLSKLELVTGDNEVHVHSDWRVSIHDVMSDLVISLHIKYPHLIVLYL